jgi:D-mannonate dehydratase
MEQLNNKKGPLSPGRIPATLNPPNQQNSKTEAAGTSFHEVMHKDDNLNMTQIVEEIVTNSKGQESVIRYHKGRFLGKVRICKGHRYIGRIRKVLRDEACNWRSLEKHSNEGGAQGNT